MALALKEAVITESSSEHIRLLDDDAPVAFLWPISMQSHSQSVAHADRVTRPVDERILVAALGSPLIRVTRPIPVSINKEDGSYVATWEGSDDFGCGDTYSEALTDFQAVVVELFLTLEENEGRLGPEPEKLLATLRQYLRFVAPPSAE